MLSLHVGFLVAESVRICLQCKRPGFGPWVGKILWKRAWQTTPVFLPGESPWTEEPGGLPAPGVELPRSCNRKDSKGAVATLTGHESSSACHNPQPAHCGRRAICLADQHIPSPFLTIVTCQEDPLEKGMATHSSVQRIPWTE